MVSELSDGVSGSYNHPEGVAAASFCLLSFQFVFDLLPLPISSFFRPALAFASGVVLAKRIPSTVGAALGTVDSFSCPLIGS